jgi:hypothetical protein
MAPCRAGYDPSRESRQGRAEPSSFLGFVAIAKLP